MQSVFPGLPPVHLQLAPVATAHALHTLVPTGAVVEARVLSLSAVAARQAAYDVLLAIGSRVLKVTSARPLEVGSQIQLTSNNGSQLRILPSAATLAKHHSTAPVRNDNAAPVQHDSAAPVDKTIGAPAKNGISAPAPNSVGIPAKHDVAVQRINAHIDQALRSALPREQPVQPTLRAMQRMLNTPDRPLPESSKRLLREVFARLPNLATVQNPRRLPDALRLSGAFLENALLQLAGNNARNTLGDDLRVALLRLAANLRARVPEGNTDVRSESGGREALLLQQVQSVLARLKVQQLSTLNAHVQNQTEPAPAPRISLELPFLHGAQIESVQLTIGKEHAPPQTRKVTRQSAWTADLDFELGELGPLHVRARLQNIQLSTVFWAPQEATLALIKRNIATLHEELARHNVQLRHIAYQQGLPPVRQSHPRPLLHVAI
ncbi:MAG: flagellar hook-length control protein FliK [Gammaproteobacteria bacterium]|nr:flagellar hook-length control protein FliK [Gammaproteobacteria bacterium]